MQLRRVLLLINLITIGSVVLIGHQAGLHRTPSPKCSVVSVDMDIVCGKCTDTKWSNTTSGAELSTGINSSSPYRITQSKNTSWEFVIEKYLERHEAACVKYWSTKQYELPSGSKPLCDCVPDTLFGFKNVSFGDVSLEQTEFDNPEVKDGHWEPRDCTPRYSLAVIIPFRDRTSHLRVLLRYLHPILQAQQLNYTIIVVEQKWPMTFNKAALMNIGYRYSTRLHRPDCVVFHDVDHIPEDSRHMYVCQEGVLHIGAYHSQHNYTIKYWNIFGAVTAFRPGDFEKVNGFSNRFFGWGGEDDDMSGRVRKHRMNILRDPRPVPGYRVIPHVKDKGNRTPGSYWMNLRILRDRKNSPYDGLNSLKFNMLDVKHIPLYVLLEVEVLNNRFYLHKH